MVYFSVSFFLIGNNTVTVTISNFEYFILLFSDADLPAVLSKDTQTEHLDGANVDGAEKTDEDKSVQKETKHWSVDRIKKEYRRFNIDLAPKVIDFQ